MSNRTLKYIILFFLIFIIPSRMLIALSGDDTLEEKNNARSSSRVHKANYEYLKDGGSTLEATEAPSLTHRLISKLETQHLIQISLANCTGIDDGAVEYFAMNCPRLQRLSLVGCSNLENVNSPFFFGVFVRFLEFPSLQFLAVNQCQLLKEVRLEAKELITLEIKKNPLLVNLHLNTPNLTDLNIDDSTNIQEETLDELGKQCPKVQQLSCLDCPQLKHPEMRSKFPHAPLAATPLPLIEYMWQTYNDGASSLNLSRRIGNNEMLILAQLLPHIPSLTTCDLSKNKDFELDDQGFTILGETLPKLSSLQVLDLQRNKVRNLGAKGLGNGLSLNASLVELNLSENNIGNGGAKSLGLALTKNGSLRKLILSYNQDIGDEGGYWIGQGLQANSCLLYLDVSGCGIGDNGAEAISQGLLKNKHLQELILNDNKIEDRGITSLTNAIKSHQAIQAIHLGRNKIGNQGGIAFGQILGQPTHLRELYLNGNLLEDPAGEAIGEALASNTTLQKIHLAHNKLTGKSAKVFIKSLLENNTLFEVYLNDNQIRQEDTEDLAKTLKHKSNLKILSL